MNIEEKKKLELKELQGRLFRVKERKKDTSPSHSGRLKVEGQEYWVNAWVAESQTGGEKYFSFRLSKVEERDLVAQDVDVLDDDIPF